MIINLIYSTRAQSASIKSSGNQWTAQAPATSTNPKYEEILKAITISWCENRIEISFKGERRKGEKKQFPRLCNIFWIKRKFSAFLLLFILTIFPFLFCSPSIPVSFLPTISVCNEALAGTDECLRFAWEEYFVFQIGGWMREGGACRTREGGEGKRFINDGIVHFSTEEGKSDELERNTQNVSFLHQVLWIDNDSFLWGIHLLRCSRGENEKRE